MSEMHEVYTCPHCKQEAEVVDGFVTCHTDGCLIAEDRMSVEEWDDHAAFVWMSEKADALAARLAALEQQHAADERALRMAREALSDIEQWSYKVITGNSEAAQFLPHKVNERAHHALAALPEPPTDAGK